MSMTPPPPPPPPPPQVPPPPQPGASPPGAPRAPGPYAARLAIDYPQQLNRVTTAFRLILIIPIAIILGILENRSYNAVQTDNGTWVTTTGASILGALFFATVLMLVFRARYPKWWFDFAYELTRFSTRVGAYFALLTDEYPSTVEQQRVHLDIDYPDDVERDLNRFLPLVKWFLAIPHFIVLFFLVIGAFFAVIVAWFAILFTGRYPQGLFDYVVGVGRWALRVYAYAFLLVTDQYPPFSLVLISLPGGFEQEHRCGHRHIQRLAASAVRNRDPPPDRAGGVVPVVGQAGGLVAHHDGDAPGEIGVEVAQDGPSRRVVAAGADEREPGRGHVVDRRGHHRDMEHRAGGRADDLRAVRIDGPGREDDGLDAGRLGRADDRAEISRVADPVEHDDERCVGQHLGRGRGRHLDDGDRRLRCFGRADPFEHARREFEHLARTVDVGAGVDRDVLLDERPSGGQRLGDEHRAFHDEATFVVTRTAAPDEAPQLLNSWIVERQRSHPAPVCPIVGSSVQRAALALSTSLVNAAASVTARSARILRSTSMPAALSPAMNRL